MIDGDTIVVNTVYGDVTVRLLGIDTPETVKPGTPVQCGGPEATRALKRFALVRERVTLTTDSTQDTFDRYRRLLAYVTGDNGRLLQVEMLETGWAKLDIYRKPFKLTDRFSRVFMIDGNGGHRLFLHCLKARKPTARERSAIAVAVKRSPKTSALADHKFVVSGVRMWTGGPWARAVIVARRRYRGEVQGGAVSLKRVNGHWRIRGGDNGGGCGIPARVRRELGLQCY